MPTEEIVVNRPIVSGQGMYLFTKPKTKVKPPGYLCTGCLRRLFGAAIKHHKDALRRGEKCPE